MRVRVAASEQRISAKDLWRDLSRAEVINVTYQAFLDWLKPGKLGIEYRYGITPADANRIKMYAAVRTGTPKRQRHKVPNKAEAFQMLRGLGSQISGYDAVRVAELCEVCDRSTLYARAKKRGVEFSTNQHYPSKQVIELVMGVTL